MKAKIDADTCHNLGGTRGAEGHVIGKEGEVLKKVGQRAREEMEKMFERKVYLNLWVKVKKGWSDNEGVMQSLGYNE